MARPLRIEAPGGIYHVTARGNGGQAIFRDDRDRRAFLTRVAKVLDRFAWRCFAYCLLGNHYHLLVQTPRPDLSRGMRQLNSSYALRFNRRHDTYGHLFQGRYGAVLVERDAHLLWLFRYIARNPVEGGFCPHPAAWPWSSHRALAGLAAPDPLLAPEALTPFGDDADLARARYLQLVLGAEDSVLLERSVVLFGTAPFIELHAPDEAPSVEIPRTHWQPLRPSLEELFDDHDRDEAGARAYREFGYRMQEIADFVGCSCATVSRRLRRWEAANAA